MAKADTKELLVWQEIIGEGYYVTVTTMNRKNWEGSMRVYSPHQKVIASQSISLFANSPTNGEKAWWRRLAREYINTALAGLGLSPLAHPNPAQPPPPSSEPESRSPTPGPVSATPPAPKEEDSKPSVWQDMLDDKYVVKVVQKDPKIFGASAGLMTISLAGAQLAAMPVAVYSGKIIDVDIDQWAIKAEEWVDDYERVSTYNDAFPYM